MDILITFSGNAICTEGLILTGQFFSLREDSRKSKMIAKGKVKLNGKAEMLIKEKRFPASMQIS